MRQRFEALVQVFTLFRLFTVTFLLLFYWCCCHIDNRVIKEISVTALIGSGDPITSGSSVVGSVCLEFKNRVSKFTDLHTCSFTSREESALLFSWRSIESCVEKLRTTERN